MQGSTGRRVITRTGVVAGSVWETRMRIDEVKGGIKVFNGEETHANGDGDGLQLSRSLRRIKSDSTTPERRKRKSWRPPESPASNGSIERSPTQLRKAKSDLSNSSRISNGSCPEFDGEKTVLSFSANDNGIGGKGVLLIGDGRENGGGDEVEFEENEIETEEETKSFDDKEIDLPVEKPKIVEEEEKINQTHEIPMLLDVEKPPTVVVYNQKKDQTPVITAPIEVEKEMFESTLGAQDQMQNIVDLVMWRDISKSAFVFGLGTFILLSSSYTKDLNFSLISAISYLGLICLAVIFLYKSIIRRGAGEYDEGEEGHMLGEEEAIWVVRMLLPYIDVLLLKLRTLFSGDPVTTMKMAVLLFVMARCGSSITIWTLTKLVFFGVFTIPKVCSSYKFQLMRYGTFWLERFTDAWESCTHKKAVAMAVFTLVWNLSSPVARVWAVFMLVVAVRLYRQQGMEGWSVETEEKEAVEEETVVVKERQEASKARAEAGPVWHRRRGGATVMEVRREIKLKSSRWR